MRYKRSTVTIPGSSGQPTHARGVATCAKGWKAVGGGHTIRGGDERGIAGRDEDQQPAVVSGSVTHFGGNAEDFILNSAYPVDDVSDQDTVPDDGWTGRVHDTGDGGDSASVYLVCLGGKLPAYRKTSVTVPAGESARARAFCPHVRPVLGGGVRASGFASASHVVTSRPIDTKDSGTVPDDGWLGAVTNISDRDLKLTVHAVCR